jgi:hypothetical protein
MLIDWGLATTKLLTSLDALTASTANGSGFIVHGDAPPPASRDAITKLSAIMGLESRNETLRHSAVEKT